MSEVVRLFSNLAWLEKRLHIVMMVIGENYRTATQRVALVRSLPFCRTADVRRTLLSGPKIFFFVDLR